MGHLIVSEVKERFRFRHDFLGIPDFHRFRGKGTISRVPQKDPFLALFSGNDTLTVGDKTPESDTRKFVLGTPGFG